MAEFQEKVLVVEDEESFVDALTIGLEHEGFVVEVARDGEEAMTKFEQTAPDVVLLDVMLPRVSGIDVCRWIRGRSSIPVLMVTARSAEIDTVVGLEMGADDYISKPFRLRELVARIRAVLRRSQELDRAAVAEPAGEVLNEGPIKLDIARHEVFVRGEPVVLPLKEFELLELLLSNPGRVLSRGTLISRIWGEDYVGDTKTLDVHIKRLRAKVEAAPSEPELIKTVRGLGYKFENAAAISA